MTTGRILAGIAVMAAVTYLCRVLTLVLIRKKIRSRFLLSVLTYLPFTVLAAMVIPDVFYSTASLISAAAGTAVAVSLSLWNRGLITVTLGATLGVYLTELILRGAGML